MSPVSHVICLDTHRNITSGLEFLTAEEIVHIPKSKLRKSSVCEKVTCAPGVQPNLDKKSFINNLP